MYLNSSLYEYISCESSLRCACSNCLGATFELIALRFLGFCSVGTRGHIVWPEIEIELDEKVVADSELVVLKERMLAAEINAKSIGPGVSSNRNLIIPILFAMTLVLTMPQQFTFS